MFNVLLTDYLNMYSPLVIHTLAFLDVAKTEKIPATGHARSRGVAYVRPVYQWDRISLLFDDASEWAEQAYGWGVSFDSDKFILRLARIFEFIGGIAETREMSQAQAAVFIPELASSPAKPSFALAPIIRTETIQTSDAGEFAALNEFGLALIPLSTPGNPSDTGLAISPYAEGTLTQTIRITPDVDLTLARWHRRDRRRRIQLPAQRTEFSDRCRRDRVRRAFQRRVDRQASVRQSKLVLIGDPNATRVEVDAVVVSAGGSVSNTDADFFVSAGVRALHVVVDASSDGFLGTILGGPIDVTPGDLLIGWRTGRGIYFEGGTSLTVTIPIDKQIGPFHLYDIGIGLDWKDGFTGTGTVTADARLVRCMPTSRGSASLPRSCRMTMARSAVSTSSSV